MSETVRKRGKVGYLLLHGFYFIVQQHIVFFYPLIFLPHQHFFRRIQELKTKHHNNKRSNCSGSQETQYTQQLYPERNY